MLMHFYWAVIRRESQKLLKQRDRLAAAMVRPVLWLWIIGGGMQALAGGDYTARLLPGIVGMTLLFGGMVGGLSIALDKDAGTMRLLVTAPVKTYHILIAKTLGAAIGAITFSGSVIAFGKLSGQYKFRLFQGAPVTFGGQHDNRNFIFLLAQLTTNR